MSTPSVELDRNIYMTVEETAARMGINAKALKARVSMRREHPPKCPGRNNWIFRRDLFEEWERRNMVHAVDFKLKHKRWA